MLVRNHYYLNTTLENYEIEDITLENNSEMERHLIAHKT